MLVLFEFFLIELLHPSYKNFSLRYTNGAEFDIELRAVLFLGLNVPINLL